MISRRSLLTQAGVLAAAAAGAWWVRQNVVWPRPKASFPVGTTTSGWLAFDLGRPSLVLIDVGVNGRIVRALLDSGAQSSVIDRTLAEQLDLFLSPIAPVVAFGVSGAPQVGRSARVRLQLGALSFRELHLAVLDLASISTASGRHFSLVLGQDVLGAVVADIDFPQGRVAFHEPGSQATPAGAVSAPARREGRELLTSIEIEGRPLDVVVDTGASGALALSPKSAEAVGLLDGRAVRRAPSITFGGLSQDRVVRARSLRFAGEDYRDVSIHIFEPPEGGRAPPGLFGVEILQRYRVILDLPEGRLDLVPPLINRRRIRR